MSKSAALFAVLCALCLSQLGSRSSAETPAADKPMDLFPVEAQIVEQTNAQRAKYGLPALKLDNKLLVGARTHASWMASSGNFSHSNQNVAENIAMGQGTPAEAMRDWMNSSGHRANILNNTYTRIGVAAYVGSNGTIYWCQQFIW